MLGQFERARTRVFTTFVLGAVSCVAPFPEPEASGIVGSTSSDSAATTGGAATSTGGPNDSADAETTGSSGTGSVDTTSRPAGSSGEGVSGTQGEGTGTEHEWYSACPCEDDIESCVTFQDAGVTVADLCFAIMSPPCTVDEECPPANSGTAVPICTTFFDEGSCALDCAGRDTTCPTGMECYHLSPNLYRCAWPT